MTEPEVVNDSMVYHFFNLLLDIISTGGPSGWPGYAVAYPKPALLFLMTSLIGINKI